MRAFRLLVLSCAASLGACTFSGLGSYEIKTCDRAPGTRPIQQVGSLGSSADVAFTTASGRDVLAAFTVAGTNGGTCVQGVDANGFVAPGCAFLTGPGEGALVPRQPAIVRLGPGHAAAIVATTAPCPTGKLLYRFALPAVGLDGDCDGSGVALPALAGVATAARAIAAYYKTPFDSRVDSIAGCTAAQPAPLIVALIDNATTAPKIAKSAGLANGVSVRPAALLTTPDRSHVLVAAPVHGDVSVWSVDADLNPSTAVTIPGLAGARAVSIAQSGESIAVVAEIGCRPQGIRLAIGNLTTGFNAVTDVALPGNDLAIAPSVAWVDARGDWLVSWISTTGSAHVLARRFDASGQPLGPAHDPGVVATAGAATSDGDVVALVPQAGAESFANVALGCAP